MGETRKITNKLATWQSLGLILSMVTVGANMVDPFESIWESKVVVILRFCLKILEDEFIWIIQICDKWWKSCHPTNLFGSRSTTTTCSFQVAEQHPLRAVRLHTKIWVHERRRYASLLSRESFLGDLRRIHPTETILNRMKSSDITAIHADFHGTSKLAIKKCAVSSFRTKMEL